MTRTTEPGPDDPVPGTENMDEAAQRTETTATHHGANVDGTLTDVVTDPAHDDRVGSDWSDEGGATRSGPATHT